MARARRLPELDPGTFPIDQILRQAVDADMERATAAWTFLGMMASNHRPEAGVFLLGLMCIHGHDLGRMAVLVRAVSLFPSQAAAEALKAEFYRVPSSPATRTYLNEVLRALTRLPTPLARGALEALVEDLIQRTVEPCRIALQDAGLGAAEASVEPGA